MAAPTLINLPPPPSDPVTPSDMGPGTPNSGTTSLSALSTTAIKDGHKGNPPPHQHHHRSSSQASTSSTNTLDAERADRISRLAGLERVATTRQSLASSHAHNPHAPGVPSTLQQGGHVSTVPPTSPPGGYFDHGGPVAGAKERSTVGSASATGSAGGRTTWASGSDMALDADKMSEDGVSSVAGMSDEASLVGFGEAANNPRTAVPPGAIPAAPSPMQSIDRVRNMGGMSLERDTADASGSGRSAPLTTQPDQGNDMMVDEPKPTSNMDRTM